MGANSKIAWTNHTFSPWWGCKKVSPACKYCYAETFAKRTGHNECWSGERRTFGDKHWNAPLKWDRAARKAGERHRVFCGSMCDIFEDRRDLDEHREGVWDLIAQTTNLDWLLLTKRPESITSLFPSEPIKTNGASVWLGVTAETEHYFKMRTEITTHVRDRFDGVFISAEPLLGVISEEAFAECADRIDWFIIGGESGGNERRKMDPKWATDLCKISESHGVPCFFKQWGGLAADKDSDRPADSADVLYAESLQQTPFS